MMRRQRPVKVKRATATFRVQKSPGCFKKAQPSGFLGGFIGFFGQAGRIGKIIQKLSNLKP